MWNFRSTAGEEHSEQRNTLGGDVESIDPERVIRCRVVKVRSNILDFANIKVLNLCMSS